MKKLLVILVLAAIAVASGWLIIEQQDKGNRAGERKVAFYQSPMHPWIKSEGPGNCTICGMKLTPIFEGEKGFDMDPNFIPLSSNQISVIHVQTDQAALRPIERTLRVSGRIEADETQYRVLSAYVDGRVEKLHVNYVGAEVQAGEPLAELFSPGLLTAEREYISLVQRSGTNETRFNQDHRALLGAARERLRRLGLSPAQIEALPNKQETNDTTQIVAPISGTVVKRSVFEGQYVKEGDRLFELANLERMWFKFDVYEQDLPWVYAGANVQVTTPALPGQIFAGKISFIDPTLNELTRSAKARVELDNPRAGEAGSSRRLLMNGMFADAQISVPTEPLLSIPRTAVLQASSQPIVFVEGEGNNYERRKIKIGRKGDAHYEVLAGLEPGEKVVTSGNLLLDSQSQLNPAVDHSHQHEPENNEAAPLIRPDEKQKQSATRLFSWAHDLSQSLASDNLPAFQEKLTAGSEIIPAVQNAFPQSSGAATNLHGPLQIIARGITPNFSNIDEARQNFGPWSRAVVDFAREWKKVQPDEPVKLYRCPMYPKPGKSAFWVQLQGPLRNPYYGAEMLDCGTEIP
ncbi:MAG: efflux RND transporter periplasmic adaptor subunit [Verrucomicrobiales bacterium]